MILRFICLALVRLFYRRIRISGKEHIPTEGPVIVVSNHVNGLIDPMLMRIALDRPVAFLAKSTLFANALGRSAMRAFGAIPVYRAKEANTAQNRKTFELSKALMERKGWLALFPEGVSHSEPTLQPLKTGAARIALSAGFDIKILPIGLSYGAKDTFRSTASATVGPAFTYDDLQERHKVDPRGTAQALTERIAQRLADVVLQAEDKELWHGFRFVARWMQTHDDDDKARALSKAYRQLVVSEPEKAQRLVEEVREFARYVDAVGVQDPRALDVKLTSVVPLVLGLPFALVGALFAWLPYRLTGPLSRKLAAGETDLVSTIKAILGFVLIGLTYTIEAFIAGWLFGAWWGAALFATAVTTGFVAIRYSDMLEARGGFTRKYAIEEIRRRREIFMRHMLDSLPEGAKESLA